MIHNHTPTSAYAHRQVDAPPPYTESSSSARSPTLTPTSSVASLPSIRSASPLGQPVRPFLDSKAAPPQADDEPSTEANATTLPPDVQRAKAPLQVRRKNTSISGNFLVLRDGGGDDADRVDVSLRTTNSSIKSGVYVEAGEWGRPVVIEACTANSSIALAVHTLQARQAVDMRAITENSSASVLLPRDFKGLLILGTSNGKKVLSPELQRVSVRVPSPCHQDLTSSGDLADVLTTEDMEWYEINGAGGPSRALVKTKNSRVSAGFVGEDGAGGERSCMVM